MLEFLIFGGLWFWLFISIDMILLILAVLYSDTNGKVWFFGVLLVAILILSGFINFTWIAANPIMFLLCVGLYIIAGCFWSMKEWYDFVKEKVNYYYKEKTLYGGITTTETEQEISKYISDHINVRDYWDDITTWIVYFPAFFLAWILTDPIKKIAQQFSFIYNGISNKLINKTVTKIVQERNSNGPKNTKNN